MRKLSHRVVCDFTTKEYPIWDYGLDLDLDVKYYI